MVHPVIPGTLVDGIVAALCENPPGWNVDSDGTLWPPSTAHDRPNGHRYDGGCAICRAGDRPEALRAVVKAVIEMLDPADHGAIQDAARAADELAAALGRITAPVKP